LICWLCIWRGRAGGWLWLYLLWSRFQAWCHRFGFYGVFYAVEVHRR
jgi:hypothetical protein